MMLTANERCPIHKSRTCACPRRVRHAQNRIMSKWETVRIGVRRIRDEHADHQDGYRYKLSDAEMRKLLLRKIEEQGGNCGICGKPFESLVGIDPDHIKPKGLGGARSDDRESNIQAAHHNCNFDKGSKRVAA